MVVVGHPGRQHSHHLAAGLNAAGVLDLYCSGQFDDRRVASFPSLLRRTIPAAVARNAVPFLGDGLHSARPLGTVLHRVSRRFPQISLRLWGEWAGFAAFDWQLARLIHLRRPRAVIAYEMAALKTFRVAKRAGIVCILDAAACHYRLQDERLGVTGSEANSTPGQLIRVRKDEEAALADLIICPSVLSAESYIAAGVPAGKIVVNTLGVDGKAFAQSARLVRGGVPRFAFIANSAYVKGADLVCAAIAHLQAQHIHAIFEVVGAVRLNAQSDDCVQIVQHGHLSQSGVADVLGKADCLLLPSRLESFGMVVLESLAAGVPVLVSKWAGSSMVIDENVNGWKFDTDPDEFISKLLWCATHTSELRSMRQNCVDTARRHSWDAYQARSVEIVGHAVNHKDMNFDAQK